MTKDEKTQALIDRVSKCCQKIADFYEISTSKVIWMGTNRFKVIKNNEEIIVFYLKNDTIITKEERDRKRYETFKLKMADRAWLWFKRCAKRGRLVFTRQFL